MKRWLKWIGLGLAIVVVLIAALVTWLLEAESGARFALERVKSALANKLSVEQTRGALASPLTLEGVRYRDPASGLDVRIKRVKVEYALSGLFSRTLHVSNLEIAGVDVALTTVPQSGPQPPAPSMQTLLTPPLSILLDRANIASIKVVQDNQPVFVADSLDLAATWTAAALRLQNLALRAPDGTLDLSAGITSYSDLRGTAKGTFDWKIQPDRRAAGSLDVDNDGKNAHIVMQLAQPTTLSLNGTVATHDNAYPWTATLHVPTFDPRKLTGNDTLQSIALDLSGSGDRAHGKVTATLGLNAHTVALDPLQYAIDGKKLTIDTVRIHSPEARGVLTANGFVQLDANPDRGRRADRLERRRIAGRSCRPAARHTRHAARRRQRREIQRHRRSVARSAGKARRYFRRARRHAKRDRSASPAAQAAERRPERHRQRATATAGAMAASVDGAPFRSRRVRKGLARFHRSRFIHKWKSGKERSVRRGEDRQTFRHTAPASVERQRRSDFRLAAGGERHARSRNPATARSA